MRILFLHPDDSPLRGPWSRQHWDLLVDLGKSSQFSQEEWAHACNCPVLRSESFRRGIADAKRVREIFSLGRGHLIDEEGIDWWDLMSLLIAPAALNLLPLRRVAAEISPSAELWATRSGGTVALMSILLERSIACFGSGGYARLAARPIHYAGLFRRFSVSQLQEIFLDKYDSGFRWRSHFVAMPQRCTEPVVLLPSAYENVSRMAAAYARLLPDQPFLLVATRQSAKQFECPANVQVRDLAAYAKNKIPPLEVASLVGNWNKLRAELESVPDLHVLGQTGTWDTFPAWLRDGLGARNAWREVITSEPVGAVLCGDDSNLFTRLPVLLAARRKIQTVDFHHGALDGRYLLKILPCDVYFAKNEMERDYLVRICGLGADRIAIVPPPAGQAPSAVHAQQSGRTSAIFFSEPYEAAGARPEEVYRELLPALCRLVRENGCDLVVKLHPFESPGQRMRILKDVLTPADRKLITLVDGPLTAELMEQAWFGITVESTTVMDCVQRGVCCFLCGWLTLSSYEYVQQYARFGIGEVLQNVNQVTEIPRRLADFRSRPPTNAGLLDPRAPAMLQRWLMPCAGSRQ